MNILFLTKSKKYTCKTLKYLAEHHNVVGVVCKNIQLISGTEMENICFFYHIPIFENDEIYKMVSEKRMPKIDLAISNTYGRLIQRPLLDWVKGNCINLHGAILPQYKGLFTYNHGLLNGEKEWGVTAHYVNEKFDEGNIISIKRFSIVPELISVRELEERTQEAAYELTKVILEKWEKEGPLKGTPQEETGRYYSLEDFEKTKRVYFTDSAELVERKIHAFWCPPYEGAYVEIGGSHFPLLPRERDNNYDK